jgi:hypothetical protein
VAYSFKYQSQQYTDKDILGKERELLQGYENLAGVLSDEVYKYFDDLQNGLTELNRIAFDQAKRYVEENIGNFVYNKFIRAAIETKEFNYAPFLDRLSHAINSHSSEIVNIYFDFSRDDDSDKISVILDFSSLGDIETYAQAVETVRGQIVGENPLAMRGRPGLGKGERSYFWKEKLYGPAREGRAIPRKEKKGSSISIESGEAIFNEGNAEQGRDKTQEYIEKYEKTIEARLACCPEDQAPFWYLIVNGNYTRFSTDIGGDSYPKFGPTYIESDIRNSIKITFIEAFSQFKIDLYYIWRDAIRKDWGEEAEEMASVPYISNPTRSATVLEEKFGDIVNNLFRDVEKNANFRPGQTLKSAILNAELYIESTETSTGKGHVRLRSRITGRFA